MYTVQPISSVPFSFCSCWPPKHFVYVYYSITSLQKLSCVPFIITNSVDFAEKLCQFWLWKSTIQSNKSTCTCSFYEGQTQARKRQLQERISTWKKLLPSLTLTSSEPILMRSALPLCGIGTSRLDQCTTLLAGNLLYKNWRRPRAVCNATRMEFKDSKLLVQDNKPLYIMSVENHKTSI